MQILASALPGFRDLRAPLTGGYLWLLLLWIAVRPEIAARPSDGIAAAIYDLGQAAGPIWVGLGVSVAAYLVGSVSQSLSSIVNRLVSFIRRTLRSRLPGIYKSRVSSYPDLIGPFGLDPTIKLQDKAKSAYLKKCGSTFNEREVDNIISLQARIAMLGLKYELAMPATLLLSNEPELFTEADRLKAESQFRLAVVPPLIAITCFASWNQSWWWLLAAVPVGILAWQGYARNEEFQSLMTGAVQRGIIRSRSVDNFREWVDNIGDEQLVADSP